MYMSMETFEKRRAFEMVEKISFPRLFGSEGSKKARMIIKEELKTYGYSDDEIKTHHFIGDRSQLFFIVKVLFFVLIAFLVIIFTYLMNHIRTCRICCLMFIPLIYGIHEVVTRFRGYKQPKSGITGENIFINLLPTEKRKATLVFTAHYDTKSQYINPVTRKKIFLLLLVGLVFFPMVTFMSTFSSKKFIDYIVFTMGMIFSLSCVVVIFGAGFVGNKSTGAVDNATSVCLILELCRIFKKSRPKHIELLFLLTDGEEVGMIGSSCFVGKYARKFDLKSTFVINIENVGIKDIPLGVEGSIGFLKKQFISPELIEYFTKKAPKRCKIGVTEYHESGLSMSDHIPFLKEGFQAIMFTTILTDEVVSAFHTNRDNMSMVDIDNLGDAGVVAQSVVECMDEDLVDLEQQEQTQIQ